YAQKAPFNDWWYWSECLVKRLRTMGDLYRENGENERADQAHDWAKRLKDNCMTPVVAARKGLKTDEQKAEVKKLEETAIFAAADMFRELLVNLPFMSSAVQDFLSVNWQDCKWEDPNEPEEIDEDTGLPVRKKKKKQTDGRITELFWGPKARQDEGIRSGKPEDGGLPGILMNLLAAEKTTSSRSPTEYGQAMLASAAQSGLATTMNQMEKMGIQVNFKPGGSI
ncbi:MAG: hypothetical protein KGI37_03520, partial [Alphaproteobacteria bacterium]|nr:hypothetical protein [Alphaproteobacteria bacterium]